MLEIAVASYVLLGAHEWLETLTGKTAEAAEDFQESLEEAEQAEQEEAEETEQVAALEEVAALQEAHAFLERVDEQEEVLQSIAVEEEPEEHQLPHAEAQQRNEVLEIEIQPCNGGPMDV